MSNTRHSFAIREGTRRCFCRVCDGVIEKGTLRFETHPYRNRGQSIYICTTCLKNIANEVDDLIDIGRI